MGNTEKPNGIRIERDTRCTTSVWQHRRDTCRSAHVKATVRRRQSVNTRNTEITPAEKIISAIISVFNFNCRGS